MSSLAQILKPDKSQLKRVLKWIVIANAVLAAVGIVVGGNPDFVARVHGTSFLLVVTAASLVAIEQGKFRTEIKYVWPIGSACSTAIGVVVIALIWGVQSARCRWSTCWLGSGRAVAITYCAVISVIAERARLRLICWVGALGHSCYVWVLIWFEISAMPGRALALLAVGQSACSLLAVIDFIGSRRATRVPESPSGRSAQYCPYCGATELVRSSGYIECAGCGGRFRTIDT
ncbi:MAG: hypothetical protein Ct9H300mP26_3070 [Acidimicrobiales bacterium]|nr:MAG: hypothetical protein Ct9H300mP26_3070 [Acidimicrobiales bacterium]